MVTMSLTWRSLLLTLFISVGASVIAREPRSKTLFMPAKGISLPLTKDNTVLAFDIHAVLVEKNRSVLGWNLFKNAGALRFANHKEVKKLLRTIDPKSAAPEDFFMPFINTVPGFEAYIPGFLSVINAQDPMPGIEPLLKKLTKRGFELDILSNIGWYAYHGWQSATNPTLKAQGLKDIHPTIFAHFKEIQVASKKPGAQAYTRFADTISKNNNNHLKNIVFIDDRWDNVQAAVNEGLIGILFKNAHQLETDLMRLKIL